LDHQPNVRNVEFEYCAALQLLVASDGRNITAIEPRTGDHRVVHQSDREHRISCIDPATGDLIFSTLQEDAVHLDFFTLVLKTGAVTKVPLAPMDGEPFWGLSPHRIINLADGGRVYLGEFEKDDVGYSHLDASGKCVSWSEYMDLDGHFYHAWSRNNNDAIFVTDGYGIYAWSFETHEVALLAGSENSWGCRDGIGWRARFWRLREPIVNSRYLFTRTEGPRAWQWRQICLDLQTLQVQTVRCLGLDHDSMITYCATENEIFALQLNPDVAGHFHLIRAPLESAEQPTELPHAVSEVDLEAVVQPVIFRLSGDVSLQVDRRVLVARSAYFRDMLSSGLREDTSNEVDLTCDGDADFASLSVLLRYVLCDTWEGSRTDPELAFRVRALADRYRLPRLVTLAEAHLLDMLSPSTTLAFLGHVVGSGGALEEACWALMDSNRDAILRANEADVSVIIAQNPELAKRLILWQTGADADPAARPQKRMRSGLA